jgi:hypothetical protein
MEGRRPQKDDLITELGKTETRIKDIILNNTIEDVDKSKTTKKIVDVIDDFIQFVPKGDKMLYRQSLKQFARKIYLQASKIKKIKPVPDFAIKSGNIREETMQVNATTVYISDYKEKVIEITRAVSQLQPEIKKSGKKISARMAAELSVRHEAIQRDLDRLRDNGINIIVVSTHANASSRCTPWQGGIYSLDDTYGMTNDGKSYIPLQVAIEGEEKDGNGLFGYNCRHRAYEYKDGMKPPVEFTERELIEGRKVDEKMRYYERKLRMLWQLGKISEIKEERKKSKDSYKILYEEYFSYARQNERAVEDWRIKN